MKKINRVILSIIVVLFMFIVLLAATKQEQAYDSSYIEDDLFGAVIDGKIFDVNSYKENIDGEIQPIYFSEFCFTNIIEGLGNYALYVYIYNPQNLHIDINSNLNKIEIANEYNVIGDPVSYSKYPLRYCTRTKNNMLYKFKVIDSDRNILNRVLSTMETLGGRRYDISGVEIKTCNEKNAKEYEFGTSCLYNGFAKGYGQEKESTLTLNVNDLRTIHLDVQHSNYLTGISSTGAYHRNNISSVYFSIPNEILSSYGYLENIKAEWYEYQTKPIIVTSNNNFYKELIKWNHRIIDDSDNKPPFQLYYGLTTINGAKPPQINLPGGIIPPMKGPDVKWIYDWAYSINNSSGDKTDGGHYEVAVNNNEVLLPISFYAEKMDEEGIFAYLNKKTVSGEVGKNVLTSYLYEYSTGDNNLKDLKISNNLITNTLDIIRQDKEGIVRGYNQVNACLSDYYNLNSYNSNHNWMDRLNDYGFIRPDNLGYDNLEVNVIQPVNKDNLNGDISEKYLINPNDKKSFEQYCLNAYSEDSSPYLFRFAVSDYYSRPVGRFSNDKSFSNCSEEGSDSYFAQQTIFLDFDIISLTFLKKGKYTVIPAVSSPNDIVAGVVPPPIEYSVVDLGIGHLKNGFEKFKYDFLQWWKSGNKIIVPILIALAVIIILIVSLLIFNLINKAIVKKNTIEKATNVKIEIVNNDSNIDVEETKTKRKKRKHKKESSSNEKKEEEI